MQDDKPPSYNSLSDPTIYRPDVMKTIEEQILLLDSELRELSLKIHGMLPSFRNNISLRKHKSFLTIWADRPELAFQEEFVLLF